MVVSFQASPCSLFFEVFDATVFLGGATISLGSVDAFFPPFFLNSHVFLAGQLSLSAIFRLHPLFSGVSVIRNNFYPQGVLGD